MKARPTALLAAATLLATTTLGCYGEFALTRKLYNWNGKATSNVFANSAIMWGLFIIPVYELAGLGDFLIFNTIEAFSGKNPMAVEENGIVHLRYAGADYVLEPTDDGQVGVSRNGVPLIRYRREGDRMIVADTAGRTLKTFDVPQAMAVSGGLHIH